jgi:hypothetical protein
VYAFFMNDRRRKNKLFKHLGSCGKYPKFPYRNRVPYRNRTEKLGTVLGSTFSIFSVLGSFGTVPVRDGSSTVDTPSVIGLCFFFHIKVKTNLTRSMSKYCVGAKMILQLGQMVLAIAGERLVIFLIIGIGILSSHYPAPNNAVRNLIHVTLYVYLCLVHYPAPNIS